VLEFYYPDYFHYSNEPLNCSREACVSVALLKVGLAFETPVAGIGK